MNELVLKSDKGNAITTSLLVAEKFGKQHKNVLASIRELVSSAEKSAQYYHSTTYKDSTGRSNDMYVMNRDGFSLLVMGFNGTEALKFKIDFIEAFNKMEQMIKDAQKAAIPQTYLQALEEVVAQIKAKELAEAKIVELQPKAEFFDAVTQSSDCLDMADVAKILAIKGFGRNNLFEYLRISKVLDKDNLPYQKYVECGYFKIVESKFIKDDEFKISKKTVVFQRGLDFIREKLSHLEK